MRRIVWVGAALAVGIVWLVLRSAPRRVDPRDIEPRTESTAALTHDGPLLDPTGTAARREEVVAPSSSSAPSASPPAQRVTLRGSIVVLHENDEYAEVSGTFQLALWHGTSPVFLDVKAADGRWQVVTDRPDAVSVERCRFGDRVAVPVDPSERIPFADGGEIALRLRWPDPLVIHVRDAATGTELKGVRVVAIPDWEQESLVVPPRSWEVDARRGDSPLRMRIDELGQGRFQVPGSAVLVRTDGYAWARVSFDPDRGGEVFADLQPACELEIRVVSEHAASQSVLRVRRAGEAAPIFEDDRDSLALTTLDAIAAGDYEVAVHSRDPTQRPEVLASAPVRVETGQRSVVVLRLADARPISTVDVAGVLVVPRAWGVEHVELVAKLFDAPLSDAPLARTMQLAKTGAWGAADEFAWRLDCVQAGRYELSIQNPPFGSIVEFPLGSATDARVEVPPPADVSVRVVDLVTGEPVPLNWLAWRMDLPGGAARRSPPIERNPSSGSYEFRCPVGEVVLDAAAAGDAYPGSLTSHTLAAGANPIVLKLARHTLMSITFRDGTRTLEPSLDLLRTLDVSARRGGGEVTEWTFDSDAVRVRVSEPGSYRVRLREALPGYLLPEVRTVDLQPGKTTDVVIRLTKAP